MKSLLIVIFIPLCITSKDDRFTDWDTLVDDSAQIISASVIETTSERYGLETAEVLKGYPPDFFTLKGAEVPFELPNHAKYLFFTAEDTGEVRLLSPPIPIDEVSPELVTALKKLRCRVEVEGLNSACYRIGPSVCECDGITYGNACEARKRGIVQYVIGDCEKGRR